MIRLCIQMAIMGVVAGGCSGADSVSLESAESAVLECPRLCEGEVPASCEGDLLLSSCVNGEQKCTDCATSNQKCVEDPIAGAVRCVPRSFLVADCVPQCEGVVCGADSCGGSCGFCPSGGLCSDGQCYSNGTPCDTGAERFRCIGELLAECDGGELRLLDCSALGRTCDRDSATGQNTCVLIASEGGVQ